MGFDADKIYDIRKKCWQLLWEKINLFLFAKNEAAG